MRFYIAARFDRLDEINIYANQLRERGYIVDCRWLQGLHQLHPGAHLLDTPAGFPNVSEGITMAARPFAEDDVQDIVASDALVLFSEPPDSHSKRGGRHVEFGIALGLGKRLIVVGPRENVFHCLPQVERFATWVECLEMLEKGVKAPPSCGETTGCPKPKIMKCPLIIAGAYAAPVGSSRLSTDCLKTNCAWYVQIVTADGYTHAGCALAILAESALDRK